MPASPSIAGKTSLTLRPIAPRASPALILKLARMARQLSATPEAEHPLPCRTPRLSPCRPANAPLPLKLAVVSLPAALPAGLAGGLSRPGGWWTRISVPPGCPRAPTRPASGPVTAPLSSPGVRHTQFLTVQPGDWVGGGCSLMGCGVPHRHPSYPSRAPPGAQEQASADATGLEGPAVPGKQPGTRPGARHRLLVVPHQSARGSGGRQQRRRPPRLDAILAEERDPEGLLG